MYLAGANHSEFEGIARELVDLAARHQLESYHGFGKCMLGICEFYRRDMAKAQGLLSDGLEQLSKSQYEPFHPLLIGALASILSSIGCARKGNTLMEAWLQRERNEKHWCRAEFLRCQGEVLHSLDESNTAAAEQKFLSAIECAREQNALSWELRAAISLEKLRRSRSIINDTDLVLRPIYKKFTEGFETADLVVARKLLSESGSDQPQAQCNSRPGVPGKRVLDRSRLDQVP